MQIKLCHVMSTNQYPNQTSNFILFLFKVIINDRLARLVDKFGQLKFWGQPVAYVGPNFLANQLVV